MIPASLYADKGILAQKISQQVGGQSNFTQELANLFTHKELKILDKNMDLAYRFHKLWWLDEKDLEDHLEREYQFEVSSFPTETKEIDYWIDHSKVVSKKPKFFEFDYVGHYLEEEEFWGWTIKLISQEIRINLWARYIEHKRDKKRF